MIDPSDVIAYCQEGGRSVTARQLWGWSKEGLIPKPIVTSLGRGKGTQSRYPNGTEKQALAVCEFLRERKNMGYVRWRLWTSGFDVDVRPILREALDNWRKEHASWWDEQGLTDAAFDMFTDSRRQRVSGFLGSVRRKIGKGRFPMFLMQVLEADIDFSGSDEETSFPTVLDAILGEVSTNLKSVNTGGLKDHLKADNLDEALLDASDTELRDAYYEVIKLLGRILAEYVVSKGLIEGELPTDRHLKEMRKAIPTYLLIWLSMRRDKEIYSGYQELVKSLPDVEEIGIR